jgi:muconate cycloisomerase
MESRDLGGVRRTAAGGQRYRRHGALARDTALPLSVDESLIGLQVAGENCSAERRQCVQYQSSKNGGRCGRNALPRLPRPSVSMLYELDDRVRYHAGCLITTQSRLRIWSISAAFMSTLRDWSTTTTDFRSFVRDGTVHWNDRPGLGIEVDEAHVRRLAFNSFRVLPTD